MSGGHSQPFSRNECNHSQTVDDEKEGTCVCTECGLVLEQLMFHSAVSKGEWSESHKFYDVLLFLKDVCANACLPEYVISYAYSYFEKLKVDPKINPHIYNNNTVAAYALYETLSRHEIPLMVNEVEYFTGIPAQKIFNLEGCLYFSDTLNNPQDFVERYCVLMGNLTYYDIKIIKGIAGNMYGMGDIRPNTIVAALIYLYSKEVNIKQDMKTICEICCVSSGNVYKIIRSLRQDFSNKISLLYT
jgi:transcription initiation factor TFIIIB Brf1 subunit/transcription initiation factor TFIIB